MTDTQEETKTLTDFKVTELRKALVARNLDGNGVKATLVSRLEKVSFYLSIFTRKSNNTLP